MVTLLFLLFAINLACLLWRRDQWGWMLALATLVLGALAFYLDVGDAALGVQL